MLTFTLIIFLKFGYAGGAVTVPNFPDLKSCQVAAAAAKRQHGVDYESGSCIPVPVQK